MSLLAPAGDGDQRDLPAPALAQRSWGHLVAWRGRQADVERDRVRAELARDRDRPAPSPAVRTVAERDSSDREALSAIAVVLDDQDAALDRRCAARFGRGRRWRVDCFTSGIRAMNSPP